MPGWRRSSGVCPTGAHCRVMCGCTLSDASSMTTSVRSSCWSFFSAWPRARAERFLGFRLLFVCSPCRLLVTEASLMQQPLNGIGVDLNTRLGMHRFCQTSTRPKIPLTWRRENQLREHRQVLIGELARSGLMPGNRQQSGLPMLSVRLPPPAYRGLTRTHCFRHLVLR